MICGFALGSNLGDRLQHLSRACECLRLELAAEGDIAKAPVFETDPVDCPPESGSFYNTVLELSSPLAPADLLPVIHRVEAALGRARDHAFHAPRTIDVDLLYAGEDAFCLPGLESPHPRLHLRRFVLEPLAALRPNLILPGFTQTIAQLHQTLTSPEPPLRVVCEAW